MDSDRYRSKLKGSAYGRCPLCDVPVNIDDTVTENIAHGDHAYIVERNELIYKLENRIDILNRRVKLARIEGENVGLGRAALYLEAQGGDYDFAMAEQIRQLPILGEK